jgi:hypothetical protein
MNASAALASPTPQIDVDNDNYGCSNVCQKAGAHGDKRLLSDTSKYNWAPCHNRPEILTYLDGRKRWFHCSNCAYFSDRAYHAQMHYQCIHVNQGRSVPRKRTSPSRLWSATFARLWGVAITSGACAASSLRWYSLGARGSCRRGKRGRQVGETCAALLAVAKESHFQVRNLCIRVGRNIAATL